MKPLVHSALEEAQRFAFFSEVLWTKGFVQIATKNRSAQVELYAAQSFHSPPFSLQYMKDPDSQPLMLRFGEVYFDPTR